MPYSLHSDIPGCEGMLGTPFGINGTTTPCPPGFGERSSSRLCKIELRKVIEDHVRTASVDSSLGGDLTAKFIGSRDMSEGLFDKKWKTVTDDTRKSFWIEKSIL